MAQEQMQEAAGQAQEKAQEAAGKAQDTMREQVDRRSTQAGERIGGTAQDLRSVGEELRKQGKETPAKLADRAAERTERIGSYLSDSDADRLLSDVEDFGRRRPWAVLAGGLVVGMAAARFLKASSQSRYQGRIRSEGPTREVEPTIHHEPAVPLEPVGAAGAVRPEPVPADPVMGR
jgi:hypothetical protein